jgi:hypothetical protein
MGARWQRNEASATKRRCGLIVQKADGTMLPRSAEYSVSFLAMTYVCGVNSPDFDQATGTLTNQRRRLQLGSDTIESVDTGADTVAMTAHEYETGDGPFDSNETTGAVAAGDDIWIIAVDANTIAFADSLEDAYDDSRIALTGTETGAVITVNSSTKRGVDGHFIYEATQAETLHYAPETIVLVDGEFDGDDYLRASGGGAYTTVEMADEGDSIGSVVIEAGFTRDDVWRLIFRTLIAKYSKTGNDFVFRDYLDTKDSHHGTVTASGRVTAVVDDET